MAGKAAKGLTKRVQETLDAVKAAGQKGIDFATLKTQLGINADGTLRPRIAALVDTGKIKSVRDDDDARKVRYYPTAKA